MLRGRNSPQRQTENCCLPRNGCSNWSPHRCPAACGASLPTRLGARRADTRQQLTADTSGQDRSLGKLQLAGLVHRQDGNFLNCYLKICRPSPLDRCDNDWLKAWSNAYKMTTLVVTHVPSILASNQSTQGEKVQERTWLAELEQGQEGNVRGELPEPQELPLPLWPAALSGGCPRDPNISLKLCTRIPLPASSWSILKENYRKVYFKGETTLTTDLLSLTRGNSYV